MNTRMNPVDVASIEDALEAEHMPFYLHDLRTNEIISFHAFLTSLSDSFTADWSAQKGFGRMEAAQIYGGGSRSIGVSFMMVAMNPDDFETMYERINKLTTLVYPQWSEGTLMSAGEGKTFIQPFSQVPTASPLCRLRVGDIFGSNYSPIAMARMMGVGNPEFVYADGEQAAEAKKTHADELEAYEEALAEAASSHLGLESGRLNQAGFDMLMKGLPRGFSARDKEKLLNKFIEEDTSFQVSFPVPAEPGSRKVKKTTSKKKTVPVPDSKVYSTKGGLYPGITITEEEYLHRVKNNTFGFSMLEWDSSTLNNPPVTTTVYTTVEEDEQVGRSAIPVKDPLDMGGGDLPHVLIGNNYDMVKMWSSLTVPYTGTKPPSIVDWAALDKPTEEAGIVNLFSNKNPIIRAFESTMGRGIAVAITGINFDWKLNSAPWNLEVGSRAPKMCEVQLSVVPIHDITPGLDHQGINRAPIYKVGKKSRSLTGDVRRKWSSYAELQNRIANERDVGLGNNNSGDE